jgi:hypothetical protein
MSIANLADRFYAVMAESPLERDWQSRGWLTIMDRATGICITVGADTHERALWVMRALNAADRGEDRLSEVA